MPVSTPAGAPSSEQPREGIGCLRTLEAREQVDTLRKSGGKKAHKALAKKGESPSHTLPGGAIADSADDGSPVGVEIVRATSRLRIWLPEDKEERSSLLKSLWSAQRMAARGRNVLCRCYWQADAEALDKSLRDSGAPPKPWPKAEPPGGAYQLVRSIVPELGTGVAAQVAREVRAKWQRERWDALVREVRTPPHWRSDAPIPVRRQESRLTHVGGDEYRLKLTLHSEKSPNFPTSSRVRIVAMDGYQRRLLRDLIRGNARQRAVAVGYHRRKRQWFVRISYSRIVEPLPDVGLTAAIHRGMRLFLVALTEDGHRWIYDGADIEATLRRSQRRRRRRQRQAKASNRVGHGRLRTLAPTEHLEGRGERGRATRCQVIARRVVRWLVGLGVTRLVIEDLSGIRDARESALNVRGQKAKASVWERVQEWPYYQLEQRIVSCAEESGLKVEQVPALWHSRTWPETGEPADIDLARWSMVGPGGKRQHLDIAAAKNVLRRARGEVMREDEEAEIKRLDGRSRKRKGASRKSVRRRPGLRGTGESGSKR